MSFPNSTRRRYPWFRRRRDKKCEHLSLIEDVTPSAEGCQECLEMGDEWVHLRLCLICGHVGCCDHSKNKHASAHYRETGHPLVQSFEPGEEWVWCYEDELMLPRIPQR